MAKWIDFEKIPSSKKTDTFRITAKEGGHLLGEIKWYTPWRKYSLFPAPNTLYETKCLKDIIEFIEDLMSVCKTQKESTSIVEIIRSQYEPTLR